MGDELRRQMGYARVTLAEVSRRVGKRDTSLIRYLDNELRPMPWPLFVQVCNAIGVPAAEVTAIIERRVREAGEGDAPVTGDR